MSYLAEADSHSALTPLQLAVSAPSSGNRCGLRA